MATNVPVVQAYSVNQPNLLIFIIAIQPSASVTLAPLLRIRASDT
jgi:hypothetical protein